MSIKIEITEEDVQTVLSEKFDESASDETCENVLNNYIDVDDIEKSILVSDNAEDQTKSAHKAIADQIKTHWDDINLFLNEQ